MMTSLMTMTHIYLRIKWKVKQFEVFHECSFQSMTLDEERLPPVDVIDHGDVTVTS